MYSRYKFSVRFGVCKYVVTTLLHGVFIFLTVALKQLDKYVK